MQLALEHQRQGTWLFRRRGWLPVVMVAILVAGYFDRGRDAQTLPIWTWFCLGVSLAGLCVRAAVVGCVPRRTSGRSTSQPKAAALNTSGMYSIVRHPLYLGNFLIWLGPGLWIGRWWLVVLEIAIFWLYYERIMFAEEAFLEREFGDAYWRWAARTPAFVPDVRRWRRPNLAFSPRNVLRREYTALCGILTAFAALATLEGATQLGEFAIEPQWLAAALLGVVALIALRFLKRHTAVLRVAGR